MFTRRTDRQTDIVISTRLLILIKNIYTLCGRRRFLLSRTLLVGIKLSYFSTVWVAGIKSISPQME